jgi:hypothetical protein
VDNVFLDPAGTEQFRRFKAMLRREFLKVYVVEKPRDTPEFRFIAVPKFRRVLLHHPFHGKGMLEVERVFVVLTQKLPGIVPGYG